MLNRKNFEFCGCVDDSWHTVYATKVWRIFTPYPRLLSPPRAPAVMIATKRPHVALNESQLREVSHLLHVVRLSCWRYSILLKTVLADWMTIQIPFAPTLPSPVISTLRRATPRPLTHRCCSAWLAARAVPAHNLIRTASPCARFLWHNPLSAEGRFSHFATQRRSFNTGSRKLRDQSVRVFRTYNCSRPRDPVNGTPPDLSLPNCDPFVCVWNFVRILHAPGRIRPPSSSASPRMCSHRNAPR